MLHVHQANEKITNAQRKDWDDLGVPCTPFENVKYLYPYRQQKDKLYANTALPVEDLAEQFNGGQAANFIYTFEHDISKVDMLFSIMTCDCIRMQQLLQKSNNETSGHHGNLQSHQHF